MASGAQDQSERSFSEHDRLIDKNAPPLGGPPLRGGIAVREIDKKT